MTNATTCPRRLADFGPWERAEGLDTVRGDGTCSFCGSLSADAFMERARRGDQLGPTDKSYKVYLADPRGKFYFQHLNEAQRREFVDLINARTLNLGYPGRFYVLPFFVMHAPDTHETGSG